MRVSIVAFYSFASNAPMDSTASDSASGDAVSSQKPTAYNFVDVPLAPTDRLINEHFEQLYSVVNIDITNKSSNQPATGVTHPKGPGGFGPLVPIFIDSRCVGGNVLVRFVIKADGTVTSVSVLKSTEPLLNEFALKHVGGFVFQPAELDSKPIALVTAT